MRNAIAKRREYAAFSAAGETLPGVCHGRILATPGQESDHGGRGSAGDPAADRQRRKRFVEGCPERACVLQTPPMSSERRKEIDRRRRRRERALKARKHEAIKAAAATKKKK